MRNLSKFVKHQLVFLYVLLILGCRNGCGSNCIEIPTNDTTDPFIEKVLIGWDAGDATVGSSISGTPYSRTIALDHDIVLLTTVKDNGGVKSITYDISTTIISGNTGIIISPILAEKNYDCALKTRQKSYNLDGWTRNRRIDPRIYRIRIYATDYKENRDEFQEITIRHEGFAN